MSRAHHLAMIAASAAVLALVVFGSSLVGSATISARDVAFGLFHPHSRAIPARIMWEIRLPRVVCAVVVGATLGTAGLALQTLVRNPIVDSYVTGVSAGASVAAAIGIAAGAPAVVIPAAGTICGLAAAAIVVGLSLRAGRIDSMRLILAGIFVSAFLAAIVSIVLLRLQNFSAAQAILTWLAGSLAGHGWHDILIALPYAAAGCAMLAFAATGLNALRLGEERAASVGAPIARTQWLVVIGSTLVTAASVSLSGIVGFVGLLAPHTARRLIGSDVRYGMPLAAIVGAILVTLADVVARVAIAPSEIPIGALLSLLGVPALFLILRRERRRATARPVSAGSLWQRVWRLGRTHG